MSWASPPTRLNKVFSSLIFSVLAKNINCTCCIKFLKYRTFCCLCNIFKWVRKSYCFFQTWFPSLEEKLSQCIYYIQTPHLSAIYKKCCNKYANIPLPWHEWCQLRLAVMQCLPFSTIHDSPEWMRTESDVARDHAMLAVSVIVLHGVAIFFHLDL